MPIAQGETAHGDSNATATQRASAKAIEDELGNRRGSNQYQTREVPENFPDASGKETRQLAAEKAGFGNETTYRHAQRPP